MVISLGTAPSKDLTADDSFSSHTSWSSTDSYYIEENEKKDILKFGVLEGGREINLLKIIWFLVLRVRKYFDRNLKIERYSDNHLVDGVERWKMFQNIFENWKIFWKLFGWWFWEEVEDILKFTWNMQDILKIERYFQNYSFWWCWEEVEDILKYVWKLQDILKMERYFENYSVDGVERGWKGQHKRISTGAGVALDIKLIFKPLSTKLSTMCTLLFISLVASILSLKPIMHPI